MNTDFGSRVRRFSNNFHEWRSHEWKSLVNHIMSDPKVVFHGNECIILFLTHYFMSWTQNFVTNNYRSLITPLSLRTVYSDLALWRHNSWFVTSGERGVLALWRHFRRSFLHVQISAKAIFIISKSKSKSKKTLFKVGQCKQTTLALTWSECLSPTGMHVINTVENT